MSRDIVLLKGLIVGHEDETYEDYALMPDGSNRFIIVRDLVIGADIRGLYKFVIQPELCTHISCGFKSVTRLKPKCTYISYRLLTKEELSKPDMSSLFIALNVSYLNGMDLGRGLAVYDTAKEEFVDQWFQDGGNERLVVSPMSPLLATKVTARTTLTSKTNYVDLVENMKRKAL
jgi:hypothetical protein